MNANFLSLNDETKKQLYDTEWGYEAVDVWPLDHLFLDDKNEDAFFSSYRPNFLPKINLIKIDVEGMESDVIIGAARVIEIYR